MVVASEAPPKELVEYVENAKRLGLNDDQVRRNAANAGWASSLVDDAFAANARAKGGSQQITETASTLPGDYRIGLGDVLSIKVWKEPDASVPMVTVRADGKISLPLVKELEVVGLKPSEAERMLSARLNRYIHGADVTVVVVEVNSRKAYLVGGVKAVGAVDLKGGMTILQALTQAGGLSEYAKRKHIYVLRNEGGAQVKLPFNYEAVIKGEHMEQNIFLLPNDTVVVPQ
jgi:polysaccharide export outer membrane protein